MNKEDERKFYDQHRAEMEQPEQVRLSEILVAPKPPTKPASMIDGKPEPPTEAETQAALDAAKAKADDLLDQIHKGAKFDDLAKKYSDGPSAKDGGDLSYFKRGTLSKELEDKVFALKAGEVTDVIRTKQGYVILLAAEHQVAGIPTMKEAEPRIQEALYMQRLQPALRTYLTTLREEAFIDIKNGYVDYGRKREANQAGGDRKQGIQCEESEKEEEAGRLLGLPPFGDVLHQDLPCSA